MQRSRWAVAGILFFVTAASGVLASPAAMLPVRRELALVAPSAFPPMPLPPKPFTVPAQPIVAASSNGYLPMTWHVTPKGEAAVSLPLSVPPGRAGMSPALSLDYASSAGNGLAGVGWSLSGVSTITRGGRSFAAHGESDGVDFTPRDRFFLDGQELVTVTATPYGADGAEYRTATETFVRVRSMSTQALDPSGPEAFTVELGDGRVRTYAPVVAEQLVFDHDNHGFAPVPVRAEWRIVSEADASGNTISYEYVDTTGPRGANAEDYWYEWMPAAIRYTANLTNGQPTHGPKDLPQRTVVFEHESRPDASAGWQAGVQRRHTARLKTIRMEAPNPTVPAPVWEYLLTYTMSGSQRSLLSAIERCESAGGCLWSKGFTYSASTNAVSFQSAPIVPAPIPVATYDLSAVSAPNGEVPAMQLPDLNGDGASDLVFGPGGGTLWEQKYYGDPFDIWLPDGKFLGGAHSLWLSQRDATGLVQPLNQGLSLARDEEPLASAHYGHVRLDEATTADLDGDGRDELVAAIDNTGAHELNNDPDLPPLYDCSVATLAWTPAGFTHTGATPCTELGKTNAAYTYYLPNEFPTFADVDGDGLPDALAPYNDGGWIGSNNPDDKLEFDYSPAWQVRLNARAHPGLFAPPTQYSKFKASPGVVTDLDGDGRAELTSEAEQSSLTFDDAGDWAKQTPDSIHLSLGGDGKPLDGYREFGDFNGDGTEDLLRLSRTDATRPGTLTAELFWNTGKGFYADSHVATVEVDAHPEAKNGLPTRLADPGIHVTDVDHDGRMDLVVFNNDHLAANQQSAPRIAFWISNGDGTFTNVDLPVAAGTRDDVKYWLDNTLRPITFYPTRLENDEVRIGLEAFGQFIPGATVLLQLVPFQDYVVRGSDAKTPGLAAGWNLASLTDVNGDGFIDVVRHVGGNDPSGGFEVLKQVPEWGDELVAVSDAETLWPALSIGYTSTPSDRPEVDDSYVCAYPLACPKSGFRVVRRVTSRSNLADLKPNDDPLAKGRTFEYAYRDPVANRQGQGFFGFSEMRVRETTPEHLTETITTFDLRTRDASGKVYPGVGVPATITVAEPILTGPVNPTSAPARLSKTTYDYELRWLDGGATHAVFPKATHTSVWEQPVAISWSGLGPDSRYVSGYAEPAIPPLHVDTTLTTDDYGGVTNRVTQTLNGIKTTVATPRINDTVNWHLGLVDARTMTTLEAVKNAVAVVQTSAYTYTSKGQLDSVTVEPNAADTSLTSTTTFAYDDYGLVTSLTSTAAGEAPRTRRVDYATAWPNAPDEHLYVSTAWAEHDNPLCVVDCRPAAWVLTHPAYGLPVALIDVHGVEMRRIYDAHGRPVHDERDGSLPLDMTYIGRGDTFGGMNGLQVVASDGAQQVLRTFDARGATLRSSFIGFDGQWINTFATYDAFGRPTAASRPSNGMPTLWTTTAYDSLDRPVTTTMPDGSASKASHSLFATMETDPAGHESARHYDVDGRLIESGNSLPPPPGCGLCVLQNIETKYEYTTTATGLVTRVVDDQGHATTTHYDRRGRAVEQDDPSIGTTIVHYNGFGDAKSTTHLANGDIENDTYDDLGRVMTTTAPNGLTTYTWDVATNGIGALARSMSPDQIKQEYRYDAQGRVIGLDQTDETQAKLSLDLGYDPQNGRLTRIDYPKAPGQAARLRAAYAYNAYGYLRKVTNATPGQPATIWQQINARNTDLALVDSVRGIDGSIGVGGSAIADHRDYDPVMGRLWTIGAKHMAANRLAVSYNYDADGLVKERIATDEAVQIDEMFTHDALHRLTQVVRNGMPLNAGVPFSATIDETYDTLGNRIDTTRNGTIIEHRDYGDNGNQPYALTTRTHTDAVKPNAPAIVDKYHFDALGRLVQDPHRAIQWTPFDLPSSVTEDGATWSFRYDANHARVKKAGPNETIMTFGGFYEKHRLGKSTRHVFHIVGADDPVADVTYTELATPTKLGATTTAYPLTDALGTTLGVADEHGTVLENDYYDSWGRRTTPDGMPIAKPTLFQSLFGAGFTSHDHDDDLGLINMKGRLYDPVLGRFLSADPIVGNAAFSQSWNAYSYVNNSPINFIDPSGFDCTSATTVSDGGKTTSTLTGCHTSDNVTLPNGDEGTIADASRAPDAGALVSTAISFAADQKRWRHLELEIKSEPKLLNGAAKKSADGTPKNGADPWGWAPRKSSKGTGLAPSPRLSAEEAWRKQVIAEGGSFGPDGTFEGYSRGNVPMGTDDLVEAVIGSAGAPARFSMQTAHTVDTLADGKKSIWTKLRKIRGWFSAAESLMYDLSGNDNARAPSPIATRPPPDDDALYRAITIAQQFRQSPDVKIAIANYLNVRRQGSSQDIASAREKLYEALENARTRERERTRTTNDDDDPPPSTEPSPDYRRY